MLLGSLHKLSNTERRTTDTNVPTVAEDLRRCQIRWKELVDESRKAVQQLCADIFLLQGQLEEENRYQSDVTRMVTNAVGVEGIQRIQAQLDVDETEYPMTRSGVKRKRGASKSNTTRNSSMSPNPPYHVLTLPSTCSRASASASLKYRGETLDVNHDDQNESDFQPRKRPRLSEYIPTTILNYLTDDKRDDTYSDSEGTDRDFEDDSYSFFDSRGRSPDVELSERTELSSETDDSQGGVRWSSFPSLNFEPHKRRRLDGYIPRTILTYTSDDKSDATYSDLEGTDRDFEDDDYSFLNSRGRSPRVELKKQSDLSSETDDSQGCMRWSSIPSSIPSFEDDPSDIDYQPPDWDMEYIWELGMANDRGWHPLFEFEYTEEIRECGGVLSSASLSTEDPDDGYNEVGKLRHFLMLEEVIFSQSLGPMLDIPKWVNRTNYRIINGMMFTPSEKLSKEQYKDDEWDRIQRMATRGFYPVDFEQRLDELLDSDHSQFYFDDDEWKAFAPYPLSSR